jgi:hypothetical protein
MSTGKPVLVMEGLVTGMIGAAVLAAWYAIFDVRTGHPLQTVSAFGKFAFRGYSTTASAAVQPQATAGTMAFYVVLFVLIGFGLTKLVHMAARHRYLRMGVWLALVIVFVAYLNLTLIVAASAGLQLPLTRVVIGSLLSTAAMAAFLLIRHRHRWGTSEPLGAEGQAPPHPSA